MAEPRYLDPGEGGCTLVDGNKRLGWLATVAFFWINGRLLLVPEDAADDLVIRVANRRVSVSESAGSLAAWIVPRD